MHASTTSRYWLWSTCVSPHSHHARPSTALSSSAGRPVETAAINSDRRACRTTEKCGQGRGRRCGSTAKRLRATYATGCAPLRSSTKRPNPWPVCWLRSCLRPRQAACCLLAVPPLRPSWYGLLRAAPVRNTCVPGRRQLWCACRVSASCHPLVRGPKSSV